MSLTASLKVDWPIMLQNFARAVEDPSLPRGKGSAG